MNARDQAVAFAARIQTLGFRVWVAERGGHGFISDASGKRVLSFSLNDGGSLSGNYGPPSTTSGTGWRLEVSPYSLVTANDVRKALDAAPPGWCGKGWTYLTTVDQHLKMYGLSSRFFEVK